MNEDVVEYLPECQRLPAIKALKCPLVATYHYCRFILVPAESLSPVRLFATPRTVARQALSFSGRNTGVGCHFLLQGIFPGIKPTPPASPALAGGFFTTAPPVKIDFLEDSPFHPFLSS